ncbi:hypothetical protein P8452_60714 [Trifolium repens]|nr:hypothetical protein P8452_60714 [Trifolium repens]
MNVLLLPGFLVHASFDNKSALAFCSRGTYTNSNDLKWVARLCTFSKYLINCGSLAWNSPDTWFVTNCESLFALRSVISISFASFIPASKASYSV